MMETQASRPKERIRENILQKVHLHIEFGSNLVDNFGKGLWADRNGHSRPLRPLARSLLDAKASVDAPSLVHSTPHITLISNVQISWIFIEYSISHHITSYHIISHCSSNQHLDFGNFGSQLRTHPDVALLLHEDRWRPDEFKTAFVEFLQDRLLAVSL